MKVDLKKGGRQPKIGKKALRLFALTPTSPQVNGILEESALPPAPSVMVLGPGGHMSSNLSRSYPGTAARDPSLGQTRGTRAGKLQRAKHKCSFLGQKTTPRAKMGKHTVLVLHIN